MQQHSIKQIAKPQLTKWLLIWGLLLLLGLRPQLVSAAPGDVERVSVNNSGGEGNSRSTFSAISADGRYVAFVSDATNLVSGDSNSASDIFVRDRLNGTTTRVSVASDGSQANGNSFSPAISADGRYVAFVSEATNLVSGDSNGHKDVFIYDRQTGTTTRVSIASDGTQADNISDGPSVSSDGRYVAFWSSATSLISNDTNHYIDVFVHDRQTGITTRVSVASDGTQVSGASVDPNISSDGRYVAFVSLAGTLVSGDTNNSQDVFVHDRQTGTTSRVSVNSSGAEGGASSDGSVAISSDGRYVTFESDATNLVSGDANAKKDIFVHDRQTGMTTIISVDNNGVVGNDRSLNPTMSSDGRYIAFDSLATNLVSGDTNSQSDIFLHDRQTAVTTRVSVYSNGGQTNSDSLVAALSGNAQFVSFYSFDDGLVGETTDGIPDVYVVELATTPVEVVCPTFPVTVADETELNEAIVCYNAITAPGDYTINLSADMNLTASTTAINNATAGVELFINGADFTIDAQATSTVRPFTIAADTTVTLQDLTIRGALLPDEDGGGIYNNGGTVTLTAVTLTENAAENGGAIYNTNDGTITLTNGTVSGNSAQAGGGIYNNSGTLTVVESLFLGNDGGEGGAAIETKAGTLNTINKTQFTGLSTLDSTPIAASGTTMVLNSSVTGYRNSNPAILLGSGTLSLVNTTISNNTVDTGVTSASVNGTLNIINSTLAGNTSGLVTYPGLVVNVSNTLIVNSTGANCINLGGTLNVSGVNLADDNSCNGFTNDSLAGANLGPLQDNGGPTLTQALLAGNPAIDAGDNTICAATPVSNVDQRGVVRPQGSTCDIGAVEAKALNSSVTQTGVTTAYNSVAQPCAATGSNLPIYTITTTLQNSSANTFTDLFFRVKTLEYTADQGGLSPALCNATTVVNNGGVGSMLAVANGSLPGGNNQFNPSEILTQAFEVGRPVAAQFRIKVDLFSSSIAAAGGEENGDTEQYLGSFDYVFDENGQVVGGLNSLFLPLIRAQ